MRDAIILVAAAAALAGGCKASVQVSSKQTAEEQAPSDDYVSPPPAAPTMRTDYFGVARGLKLAEGKRDAVCACVAAVVGYPKDEAFAWNGPAPKVGSDALVAAIGTEGIACTGEGRGPSIRAVDRVGEHVVIVLEEYRATRPQALGAIIPNPGPNGGIYLRAEGRAPYGRPLGAGEGPRRSWCRIGKGTGDATPPPRPEPTPGAENPQHEDW